MIGKAAYDNLFESIEGEKFEPVRSIG